MGTPTDAKLKGDSIYCSSLEAASAGDAEDKVKMTMTTDMQETAGAGVPSALTLLEEGQKN